MMGSAGLSTECPEDKEADPAGTLELSEEERSANPDQQSSTAASPSPARPRDQSQPRGKSMLLALVLAFFFGPFGLLYVSWKRTLFLFLTFIVGVALIPNNGFVVLLLWMVVPILSIILLGVGKRQPPPA